MEAAQEKIKNLSKPNVLGKKSFFSPFRIQTKLTVNFFGEKYEVVADQMANHLMQRFFDSNSEYSSFNQDYLNQELKYNSSKTIRSVRGDPTNNSRILTQPTQK